MIYEILLHDMSASGANIIFPNTVNILRNKGSQLPQVTPQVIIEQSGIQLSHKKASDVYYIRLSYADIVVLDQNPI